MRYIRVLVIREAEWLVVTGTGNRSQGYGELVFNGHRVLVLQAAKSSEG